MLDATGCPRDRTLAAASPALSPAVAVSATKNPSPSGECAPLPGPQELPRFPATRPRTTPEEQKTAVRSPTTAPDHEQEFLPRWRQPPAAADPTDKRPRAPRQGQGAPTWAACCGTRRPLRGHHQLARSGIASQPGCPRTPARAGAARPSPRSPRAVGVCMIKMQEINLKFFKRDQPFRGMSWRR